MHSISIILEAKVLELGRQPKILQRSNVERRYVFPGSDGGLPRQNGRVAPFQQPDLLLLIRGRQIKIEEPDGVDGEPGAVVAAEFHERVSSGQVDGVHHGANRLAFVEHESGCVDETDHAPGEVPRPPALASQASDGAGADNAAVWMHQQDDIADSLDAGIEGRVWRLLAVIRWQLRYVHLERFRLQGTDQLVACFGHSPSPGDEDDAGQCCSHVGECQR